MFKKATILISIITLLALCGTGIKAQESKSNVSVFIENPNDFLGQKDGQSVFHFHILYDDRFISSKEIQSITKSIAEVEKFGIRNYPNMKTGRYLSYLKTTDENPMTVFNKFLKKFNCSKVSYQEENISINSLNKKVNNLK